MDMDGLSIQTMLKFINSGYIKEFADIYHLPEHFDEISRMEGFGEKSCENMKKAIEKSKSIHPVNFIYSLCIPMIGIDAAKKLVNTIGFEEFIRRMKENQGFEDIEGIGIEKSNSVHEWYCTGNNRSTLDNLLKEVDIQRVEVKDRTSGTCAGITFVITGDVFEFKNRDEFKSYVEAQGGKVTGSVSKKTNYLVNNDVESDSSKNKKAKQLGIPIISETEFIEKFGR